MKFSEEFFREETIEGFTVSRMMKRAWAAQMEVLNLVAELCEKNGIQYYADWGTLLGAVRHQGFIPWDDDIDICIKREEFDKLVKILPEQLPKGYRVLGVHSPDPKYQILHKGIQLRVSSVRNEWDMDEYLQTFHGYPFEYAGIDIFPLDVIPDDPELYGTQESLVSLGMGIVSNWEELEETGELADKLAYFEEFTDVPMPKENRRYHVLRMMDACSALFHEDEGRCKGEIIWLREMKNKFVSKECWDEVLYMPFHNMQIAVPGGYEEILCAMYGDYQKPVMGNGFHDYPYFLDMQKKFVQELRSAGINSGVEDFSEAYMKGQIQVNWRI